MIIIDEVESLPECAGSPCLALQAAMDFLVKFYDINRKLETKI
jgi:hypothetical protein